MVSKESSTSLPENIVAGISYLFLWVSGTVVFLVEERSRYVKVHAAQSMLVFGILTVLMFLSWIFSHLPLFGLIFSWAQSLLSLITSVLWIVLMYYSLTGETWIVPGFKSWIDQIVRDDAPTLF